MECSKTITVRAEHKVTLGQLKTNNIACLTEKMEQVLLLFLIFSDFTM